MIGLWPIAPKLHSWTFWHRTERGLERVCMECWVREVADA